MHPVPLPPRSSSSPSIISASTTRVHPSDDVACHDHHHDGGGGTGRASSATATSRRAAGDGGGHGLGLGLLQGRRRPADAAAVYTVWKRSSMGFQGTDGFSVYDAAGALAFRVDNYSRRRKLFAGELLLMDGRGAPLLTLRPQILSMRDQWNCYRASEEATPSTASGDKKTKSFPRRQHVFSMRKCSLVKGTDEAEVYMAGSSGRNSTNNTTSSSTSHHHTATPVVVRSFRVQGSFWRRSCKIRRSGDGEEVARITRKKAGAAGAAAASSSEPVTLGEDVFSLTVMPDADCTMVMAFVVVMDRICQRPYKPLMCSA